MSELRKRRPRLPFWDRVLKSEKDACWLWQGYRHVSGHGMTTYKSLPTLAHRKAWILTHGPILGNLCVNHRCDNALCCNPEHLYLGTRADNMIDRWSKAAPDARMARGRPHILTEIQLERLWEMRERGATLQECGKEFGVHHSTIARYITTVRRAKGDRLREARLVLSRISKV